MAKKLKVFTVDWRKFGDYSAVGQLTKKLFSSSEELAIFSLQCLNGNDGCNLYTVEGDKLSCLHDGHLMQDSVQAWVKSSDMDVIYIRISPHIQTLEMACKLAVVVPRIPLVVHYMDQPFLDELSISERNYIKQMYSFLIKRSSAFYTIHESSVYDLSVKYHKKVNVVGNFFNAQIPNNQFSKLKNKNVVEVSYFGSLDKKMNAQALSECCKAIAGKSWLKLTIWSNSGLWGDVEQYVLDNKNITFNPSSLSEEEYLDKLLAADILLLPYNIDTYSTEFLKHSFSNKLIDYLATGNLIVGYGSAEIPTMSDCLKYSLAIVCAELAELQSLFSNRASLVRSVEGLLDSGHEEKLKLFAKLKQAGLCDFYNNLNNLACSSVPKTDRGYFIESCDAEFRPELLSFVIRRKFLDKMMSTQSLSSTISAQMLLALGYKGFNYEI